MGFVKKIFTFTASVALVAGCSGTIDDSELPLLTVSDAEIDLAAESEAVFTVMYKGQDVTAGSEFFAEGSDEPYGGNVFTPEEEGTYSFHAEYDGMKSNAVTVTVTRSAEQAVESKYEKHVCIFEFTGAWCTFCPAGYERMHRVMSKPSMAKYAGKYHYCAFHSNSGGKDDMAIPETEDAFRLFKGIDFPSFISDLRYAGNLNEEVISYFQESVVACFNEHPVHCGVAVSSELNSDATQTKVSVKVASEKTMEYRVIVLLLENMVKGPQKDPTYQNGNPDYIHNHVVRDVVTVYEKTFTGEKITADGTIRAGSEAVKSWDVGLNPEWKPENMEIYALALDADGHVDNMNVCPVVNGDSEFNLKK